MMLAALNTQGYQFFAIKDSGSLFIFLMIMMFNCFLKTAHPDVQ
jgi:hypothetical protein